MKKIYILLLMIGSLFTAEAQQVSFSVQAHPDDWQLFMSSKIMEEINASKKMVFITLSAGDEGNGTAALNSSAMPYYLAREKGGVYSAKFAYDISNLAAACALDTVPGQQIVSVNGHNIVKYTYKTTVSYFLRLPDGGAAGNGFTTTGNRSLLKLKNGSIASISSLDAANTYNGWTDLTSTLRAIIAAEKGVADTVVLHTGSIDATYNPNDNSDHANTAAAAKEATSFLSWVGYVDYVNDSSAVRTANLSISKFQDAVALFGMHDYSLTINRYPSKLNAANINLLTMDYCQVTRAASVCSIPQTLTVTNITATSATLSWRKVASALGYVVEYGTGTTWVSAGATITDSFVVVSGLTGATNYQWRVRTKCLANGNGSDFTQAEFTTALACNAPTGLSSTNISSNGATLSWTAATGAVSYVVESKLSTATTWTIASTVTTTSYAITGLNASTTYDWRVKTNCSATTASGYTQAQFTTAAALVCAAPTGLTSTNITSTGATLGWTAVTGAASYVVESKLSAATTWTVAATVTGTSYAITGLNASTTYDWRVKTNCSATSASSYTQAQFVTPAPPTTCTDILEYNNCFYDAKDITPGLNYNAQIATSWDKDYYKFSNTSAAKNIKITLTDLPYDYDVKLYNAYGCLIASSQNWGTNSETIIVNTTSLNAVGTYRVLVYGYNCAYSATKCYNLKVEISNVSFAWVSSCATQYSFINLAGRGAIDGINTDMALADEARKGGMGTTNAVAGVSVYPIPAKDFATVSFEGGFAGKGLVTLFNSTGTQVLRQPVNVTTGYNNVRLNTQNLTPGIYTVNINYGNTNTTKQVIIMR